MEQSIIEFREFSEMKIFYMHELIINETVKSAYDLFVQSKNLKIFIEMPDEQIHIKGREKHLDRVLNNLIINAVQSIPSDKEGIIRLWLYREDDRAIIKISDNGSGIPPNIQGRIFEPNFTTKTTGSGLGLAICLKIIQAHNGTIDFETKENVGTDFFIKLPIIGA